EVGRIGKGEAGQEFALEGIGTRLAAGLARFAGRRTGRCGALATSLRVFSEALVVYPAVRGRVRKTYRFAAGVQQFVRLGTGDLSQVVQGLAKVGAGRIGGQGGPKQGRKMLAWMAAV